MAEDADSLLERIQRALSICRVYLRADGGDVELLRVTSEGVVEVRFHGTCTRCPMSVMTLRAGLERAILNAAPEIKRVESVK